MGDEVQGVYLVVTGFGTLTPFQLDGRGQQQSFVELIDPASHESYRLVIHPEQERLLADFLLRALTSQQGAPQGGELPAEEELPELPARAPAAPRRRAPRRVTRPAGPPRGVPVRQRPVPFEGPVYEETGEEDISAFQNQDDDGGGDEEVAAEFELG